MERPLPGGKPMPGPLGLVSLLAVRPFLSLTWLSEPQGLRAGGPKDQVFDAKKRRPARSFIDVQADLFMLKSGSDQSDGLLKFRFPFCAGDPFFVHSIIEAVAFGLS